MLEGKSALTNENGSCAKTYICKGNVQSALSNGCELNKKEKNVVRLKGDPGASLEKPLEKRGESERRPSACRALPPHQLRLNQTPSTQETKALEYPTSSKP